MVTWESSWSLEESKNHSYLQEWQEGRSRELHAGQSHCHPWEGGGTTSPENISKCPQFPQNERKSRPSAVGSEGGQAALELPDPEQCELWPGQSPCLQFYTWASASSKVMEVLTSSTSWMYLEVWLLPRSSVPAQSRSFLDRSGAADLDLGVLT